MSRSLVATFVLLLAAACARGERKDVGLAETSKQTALPETTATNPAPALPPDAIDTAATQPSQPTPKPMTSAKPAPKPKPTLPEVPAGAPSPDQLSATMSKLSLFVYPAKGQSKELETREEQICYVWAVNQTGIDPIKISVNADSAAQQTDTFKKRISSCLEGKGYTVK
jgi:hypothetical protein